MYKMHTKYRPQETVLLSLQFKYAIGFRKLHTLYIKFTLLKSYENDKCVSRKLSHKEATNGRIC